MSTPWRTELQRIAAFVLSGIVVGTPAGNIAIGLLITITVYLGWHLYNVYRLVNWLREGKKSRLSATGSIWDDVFEYIYRLQQCNHKRKRDLRRLTERFYRVDNGRSRSTGGTGLGLAIVKHVLLRHEGWLEIESEPGSGSEFRCHFPSESCSECMTCSVCAA